MTLWTTSAAKLKEFIQADTLFIIDNLHSSFREVLPRLDRGQRVLCVLGIAVRGARKAKVASSMGKLLMKPGLSVTDMRTPYESVYSFVTHKWRRLYHAYGNHPGVWGMHAGLGGWVIFSPLAAQSLKMQSPFPFLQCCLYDASKL